MHKCGFPPLPGLILVEEEEGRISTNISREIMPQEQTKVVIVGAGLVGSMAAIYMARLGYEVVVYEKRPGNDGLAIENFQMLTMNRY